MQIQRKRSTASGISAPKRMQTEETQRTRRAVGESEVYHAYRSAKGMSRQSGWRAGELCKQRDHLELNKNKK